MGSPPSHPRIDILLFLQAQPSQLLLLSLPYPASPLLACSSPEATAFMSLFSGTVSRTPALDSLSLLATPPTLIILLLLILTCSFTASGEQKPVATPTWGFPSSQSWATHQTRPHLHTKSRLTTQASLFPNSSKQGQDPPPRVWDNEVAVGDCLQALFRLVWVLRQILEDQPWVSGGKNQTNHSPGEGCQACKEKPCVKERVSG